MNFHDLGWGIIYFVEFPDGNIEYFFFFHKSFELNFVDKSILIIVKLNKFLFQFFNLKVRILHFYKMDNKKRYYKKLVKLCLNSDLFRIFHVSYFHYFLSDTTFVKFQAKSQSKPNNYIMETRLNDIKQTLEDARNEALLGKYQESTNLFKTLIDIIQQEIILNNIDKKNIEQWRIFQSKVIQQKNMVEGLKSMISGLSNNSSIYQGNPFSFNKSKEFQKGFGPDFNKTKTHFRATTRNFSVNFPGNHNQTKPTKIIKDPDVWDLPQQIQLKKNKNKPKLPQQPISRANKKFNISKTNPKASVKNFKKEENKNSFLHDRYPNGQGPDANLIQMLERDVIDFSPNVNFEDIAQLQKAKGLLQQAVLLPLKMPQFFTGIRRAWKGVLMFGPPGTGKTLLAKAVASSGGTKFFNVSASSLASKWKGQSQKLVRILFEMAKFYAPSVIFFDEIDALGGKRKDGEDESNRKVKTQLLVQMDGATTGSGEQNKFVIVLAATNRPWDLDEALRRRLQKRIYIPLPNEKGRKQLMNINLKNLKIQQNLDIDFIVKKTEGYSGADITNLCRQAAYMPMRKKLKSEGGFKNISDMKNFQNAVNVPLTKEDFIQALKNVNKSVSKDDLSKYDQWMKQFGTV